jgi:hypothetical protein
MKKRSIFATEEIFAQTGRERTGFQSLIVRRILAAAAIALLVALVLAAEWRLPPELRFGFFEATYASP